VGQLVLPQQSRGSIATIVAQDLANKTPFKADDIYSDYAATEQVEHNKITVHQWITRWPKCRLMSELPSTRVEWSPALSAPAPNGARRRPIDGYRQILTRPLFFKSREPYVPPPPPPPAPIAASPASGCRSRYLARGNHDEGRYQKGLFLRHAGTGGTWTSEGDEFMGWKVTAIDRTGTRREQRGHSLDLQLYVAWAAGFGMVGTIFLRATGAT
jgi:hypothetical protein